MEANGKDGEEKVGGNGDIGDFIGLLHRPGLFISRLLMTRNNST